MLFFFIVYVGYVVCSLLEVDIDSCSYDLLILLLEFDLLEEEYRVLGDQIILNSNNIEFFVDYGLNGDNFDWQRRLFIYLVNMDIEFIYWFNLFCYKNRVSNWDLDDKDLIRLILNLFNLSFLFLFEEYVKLCVDYIILVL